MRKRLIVLVLCAVLVSAMSVTSVVSAREVGTDGGARQTGINYIIGALRLIWRGIQNPTQIPIGTPIALLVIGIAMTVSNQNLGVIQCDPETGICYHDHKTNPT